MISNIRVRFSKHIRVKTVTKPRIKVLILSVPLVTNYFDRDTRASNLFYQVQNKQRRKGHKKKNKHWNNCSNCLQLMRVHGTSIYVGTERNVNEKVGNKGENKKKKSYHIIVKVVYKLYSNSITLLKVILSSNRNRQCQA